MGSQPQLHRDFFLKRLGQTRLDALEVRAHTPQRVDEKLIALGLKETLKRMKIYSGRGPALS